jgi:hypothetical protein
MSKKKNLSGGKKGKILIIVRGGVVQNVFSKTKDLAIEILDFDDLVSEPQTECEILYQQKTENLLIAH